MKKELNKGLLVLVVILSLLVVGLSSYLIYDKVFKGDNIDDKKNDDVEINDSVDDREDRVENKIISTKDFIYKFVGKYKYGENFMDNEGVVTKCNGTNSADGTDYVNLELKIDGTYIYRHGVNCGGGTSGRGKYAINLGKIYLFNDDCSIVLIDNKCMYPNCDKVIELDYVEENSEITISSSNIKLEKY